MLLLSSLIIFTIITLNCFSGRLPENLPHHFVFFLVFYPAPSSEAYSVVWVCQNCFLCFCECCERKWKWSCSVMSDSFCDPVDCSPPGSSIHGILQARILEWVAIPFSRGSSQSRDRTHVSRIAGIRFNLWATREAHLFCFSTLEKWPSVRDVLCSPAVHLLFITQGRARGLLVSGLDLVCIYRLDVLAVGLIIFLFLVGVVIVHSLSCFQILCDPMNCSTQDFPVLDCLPEFA